MLDKKETEIENLRFLIIDDDRFSIALIKTALHQFNIQKIKEANNAINAIEILKKEPIDILLIDHEMPGITGMEFARLVRKGEEGIPCPDIPILIITGNSEKETVNDALDVGVQEYLVKPISPAQLNKKIKSALSGKTLKQKAEELALGKK